MFGPVYSRKAINPKMVLGEFKRIKRELLTMELKFERARYQDAIDPKEIHPLYVIYRRIGQLQSVLQNMSGFEENEGEYAIQHSTNTRRWLRRAMAHIKKGRDARQAAGFLKVAYLQFDIVVNKLQYAIRQKNDKYG